MRGTSIEHRIYSIGKTILCFMIFLICTQPLLLSYFLVSVTRLIWRNILIMKNQHLIFVKKDNLRSFSYTSRNPGIVNICVQLQGDPNVETIQNSILQTVLQRKPKDNELMFPKLTAELVTCWGFYAWKMCTERFDIKQQVIVWPSNYRGRQVSESNIQEYISNIVSKYLPPSLPPWQICIIPIVSQNIIRPQSPVPEGEIGVANGEDQPASTECSSFYVVVRMHHLLISEEPHLRLSDLLDIDSTTSTTILNNSGDIDAHRQIPKSPLTNIVQYPTYIPQLITRLHIGLTNSWNEFKSKYDPYVGKADSIPHQPQTERFYDPKQVAEPKISIETLSQLLASLIVSYVSIATDFYKGFYAIKNQPIIKLKFLNSLINREVNKRNISWDVTWNAIWTTMSPIHMAKSAFGWMCWLGVTISILSPHLIYRELQAFRYCFFQGHNGYPDTLIGFLFVYVPLGYRALNEMLHFLVILFQAPRFIYEELIQIHHSDEHVLQNISLCGRKVVSWSNKISVHDIRNACIKYGISPTELYMSATSATIMEILNDFESVPVPKQIRIFATHHQYDYLHSHLNNDNMESGYLCLTLPMDLVSTTQIKQIANNFRTARDNQIGIYILFMLHKRFNVLARFLPAMWTVIIFNYLSRRFSITVTEIMKISNSFQPKTTLTCWGHVALDALYFSPSQSNGSMSLSIQQFGDYIRLGVIADAQIQPLHVKLSDGWTRNLQKLF